MFFVRLWSFFHVYFKNFISYILYPRKYVLAKCKIFSILIYNFPIILQKKPKWLWRSVFYTKIHCFLYVCWVFFTTTSKTLFPIFSIRENKFFAKCLKLEFFASRNRENLFPRKFIPLRYSIFLHFVMEQGGKYTYVS